MPVKKKPLMQRGGQQRQLMRPSLPTNAHGRYIVGVKGLIFTVCTLSCLITNLKCILFVYIGGGGKDGGLDGDLTNYCTCELT